MSKLHEDLLDKDWTETTLGDCQVGDEVVTTKDTGPKGIITDKNGGGVRVEGVAWTRTRPVLRAPRPEPVFERGEVWRCRNNETGEEGSLVHGCGGWRGFFPDDVTGGVWSSFEVTPLRKLLNADGTPAQDFTSMSEDLTNEIRAVWVRYVSLGSVPLGMTVRDVERAAGRQFDAWLDGVKARASALTPEQAEQIAFAAEFNELAGGSR